MEPFRRTVVIGKITNTSPHSTVEVEIEWDGSRLSITGSIFRRHDWDIDSAGQIVDSLSEVDHLFVTPAARDELVEVWHRWHLNDMRAGCEHQTRAGWGDLRLPDNRWAGHVYPHEHEDGVLTKPCEICGYKYGSAWLHEDVPEDVLEFLANLDSARVP